MSSIWNFIFGVVLILVWIIAGGFVTQASVYLTGFKGDDDDMKNAYWYTTWASIVTWFLVAVFIILVILAAVGVVALFGSGAGEAEVAEGSSAEVESSIKNAYNKIQKNTSTISWATIIFLIFAFILVCVTGVLASIAASDMVKSKKWDPSNEKLSTARKDCIIAASMSLTAAGLLIIGFIVYLVVSMNKKKEIEEHNEKVEAYRSKEVEAIHILQAQTQVQKLKQEETWKKQLQEAAIKNMLNKLN